MVTEEKSLKARVSMLKCKKAGRMKPTRFLKTCLFKANSCLFVAWFMIARYLGLLILIDTHSHNHSENRLSVKLVLWFNWCTRRWPEGRQWGYVIRWVCRTRLQSVTNESVLFMHNLNKADWTHRLWRAGNFGKVARRIPFFLCVPSFKVQPTYRCPGRDVNVGFTQPD